MSVAEWSMQCFGVRDFAWFCDTISWRVFRNCSDPLFLPPAHCHKFYHGTTLSQCREILQNGFQIGMHHAGTKTSPVGIWGTSHPGHSVERVCLRRGYSYTSENPADKQVICGWDVPVVLAWDIDKDECQSHRKLQDGTIVWVHKQPCNSIWNARERPTEIWIHRELYQRFHKLPDHWRHLQDGTAVACRSRRRFPEEDLYMCGHASAMTCARVCPFVSLHEAGWKQASATKQWRCPCCDILWNQGKPCTG